LQFGFLSTAYQGITTMKSRRRQDLPVSSLGLMGSLIPMSHAFRHHAPGLACLAAMTPFSALANFSGLEDLPGGGNTEAFRGTQAGGMASLGSIVGYADSYATAVSADGSDYPENWSAGIALHMEI
jgi:hypothetical protein